MGILSLLTFPVTGPIQGVIWLAEKLSEQAEHELYNEEAVRSQLIELELSYDMGEIDEDTFEQAEALLLARLKEIRDYKAAHREAAE